MIHNLIDEIQDKNIPVSNLLRKAKVLVSKLDQVDFLKWVDLELGGYEDDDVYPDYRKLSGKVYFWHPYSGWRPVFLGESEWERAIASRHTNQSISEIEELLRSNLINYEMSLPASVAAEIMSGTPLPQTYVSLFIDSTALVGILNAVRNSLLDWALKLEREGIGDRDVGFVQGEKGKEADAILLSYTKSNDDIVSVPKKSKFEPVLGTTEYRKNIYGYLQLFPRTKMIRIGKHNTRTNRLIRCLFSPENKEADVSYTPTLHDINTVYEKIALLKDKVIGDLQNHPQLRKQTIIETTIKEVQKIKALQGYINFEWGFNRSKIKMSLHPKEG